MPVNGGGNLHEGPARSLDHDSRQRVVVRSKERSSTFAKRRPMFPLACLLRLIAAASSCLWSCAFEAESVLPFIFVAVVVLGVVVAFLVVGRRRGASPA